MTRLIDADALSKDLEKRWNVNDDQDFCNKEVWHALEEAPTIELDSDTISRRAAILAITGEPPEARYPSWYADRIKSLPSAETPTVLEKHQLSEETSTDTSTDLISRQDAIDAVWKLDKEATEYVVDDDREIHGYCTAIGVCVGELSSIPSAPDSRQRGEWVDEYGNRVEISKDGIVKGSCWCNQCGIWNVASDEYAVMGNFCPNCGARMYKGGAE